MKHFTFLIYMIAISSSLFGEILETQHFSDLARYGSTNTLIVLDIDDTLLIPVQTLGTDVWFRHRMQQHEDSGMSKTFALEKALAEWEALRHLTKVKLVEAGTDRVIADLQNHKVKVIGLTTQGLALATRTVQQLLSLNIDLSKTAPSPEDHYFMNGKGVLYRNGILFTSGTPKGKALIKLLELCGYQPDTIVFINDKGSHLKEVEEDVEANGMNFVGLRYSYSDERVENFDAKISEIQWNHSTFSHILSDEEAVEMLKK